VVEFGRDVVAIHVLREFAFPLEAVMAFAPGDAKCRFHARVACAHFYIFLYERTVRPDQSRRQEQKKTDVAEHPQVKRHIGLLFNKPPGSARLLFIQSSESSMKVFLSLLPT
jgi:hypothetical protein